MPFNNFPTLALQMLKAGEWQMLDSNHAFEAWKAPVLTFIRICQVAERIDRFPLKQIMRALNGRYSIFSC